jgi:hypothetical protein
MNWYYAKDGQQQGPVDDAELARLVGAKTILPTTLVWREGLAEWQAYQQVWVAGMPDWRPVGPGVPPPPSPPPPPPETPPVASADGRVACSECRQPFPPDQLIAWGGRSVCAQCKPILIQRMQEGVASSVAGSGLTPMDPDQLVRSSGARVDRLDVMACLARSWGFLKAEPLLAIGSVAIVTFLMLAGGAIPILSFCIGLLVNTPLMGGVWSLFLKALRGETVSFEEVFSGFTKRWLPLILLGLVQIVVAAVAVGPFAGGLFFLFQSNGGVAPAGLELVMVVVLSLVLMVLSIYLNLAMFFAVPLMMDRGYGVMDSLNVSRRIVNQNIPVLLLMGLLSMLLLFGGVLAICLGLVVAIPVALGMWAAAYEELCGSRVPPV